MDDLKFIARKLRWKISQLEAKLESWDRDRVPAPPIFIVGCGRSGTTFFAQTLAKHSGVRYFNEPRAYWHLIDKRTDDIGLYGPAGTLQLNSSDVTQENLNFCHLFFPKMREKKLPIIIDKTPSNVFRLNWLKQLYPGAKFINIVRNGNKVLSSIMQRCRAPQFRISFYEYANQWWGRNECKKYLINSTLAESNIEIEADFHFTDLEFAALEWILSVQTANAFHATFPADIMNVDFDSFLENKSYHISKVFEFLSLPYDAGVLNFALQNHSFRKVKTLDQQNFFERSDVADRFNSLCIELCEK